MKNFVALFAMLFAVAALSAQKVNTLTPEEAKDGWKLLFDGKTTAGWHGYNGPAIPSAWTIKDGALNFNKAGDKQGGDIITDQEFDNFELRLEWKISKGGNSGIFIGVNESPKYQWTSQTGIEMQVLDNIDGADRHDPKHLAGAMYDLIDAKATSKPKPVGEWNEVRILKQDGQVTFWLNGIMTANAYTRGADWLQMVAGSKFKGSDFGTFQKGKIALQDHGNEVWYRNIRIKTFPKTIGLQLYSLRDDIGKDFDGVIKAIAEMGYKQVEAANYNNGKFYGLTPAEYKAKLDAVGIESLSSHTGNIPSNPDELFSDNTMKWWDECIAAHKAAGMKYLVVPGMHHPDNLAHLKKVCDLFNIIGEKCKQAGIKFGYHNHSSEFTTKPEGKVMYDFMLENTNPEFVFFEMDIYWVSMAQQGAVEYFKRYPGRFKLLHVKDRKELGQSGLVDFEAIFNNATLAGVENLIIEVEQYDYTPRESVRMSFDYLNNSPYVKAKY